MLKRNLLIWLTFFILIFAFSANSQSNRAIPSPGKASNQPQSQPLAKQQKAESDKRGTEQSPLVIKMAPSPNAKEVAAQAKKEKDERTAIDRRSEVTTRIIGFATFLQAVALIITILVMIWIGIRQLRAYVFVDTVDIFNIIPPPSSAELPPGTWSYQPTFGPFAYIVIKNSGNTPAYGVLNWGEIHFKEFPLASALHYGDRNAPGLVKAKFAMPPGGKTFKGIRIPQPLSDNEVAQLRAGTHAIYVYGDIVYKDIFGKTRLTNFRYFINGINGFTHLSNTMSGCEEGNEAN